ncbi:polysaccharide deacetylase [Clostridiaceae bacterium]|nr:polysaccharide deacetylase [Clostridiaceae bacterium]RKI08570.1 polysaccharide deacetylase [bacterium 1XD21-70]
MLLTFDDGYIDNFTVALPLLRKHGMQGSFFIPGKTFMEKTLLDVNKIHFILASAPEGELKDDLLHLLSQYRGDGWPGFAPNEELYERYAVPNRFDSGDVVFVKRVLQTAIPEGIRSEIASILFKKYVGMPESDFSRELYMNRDQIRCLKGNGMFIGLHGYDHYWLGNLSREEMERDMERALEAMDEFIDTDGWVMNYPYGNYSGDVIRYIAGHGCRMGLTTEVGVADLGAGSRYQVPRLDCNDFPPKSEKYLGMLCRGREGGKG